MAPGKRVPCFRGALAALLFANILQAQAPEKYPEPSDLTKLSPEELMDTRVTSASKKEQRLSQAAQAIYVISQEDIRRSGATTIAEALRMAPGLNVAEIDSHSWAISARGFNSRFANKLLVLIDGRSVYTPLFSGVFWDVQDTVLEDIDRIEVIRGPGATLWGANAVNGVINIITKAARETQGTLVTAGGGAGELGFGEARFGGKAGADVFYRLHAKYFRRDRFQSPEGEPGHDEWDILRGGFKLDWNFSPGTTLSFQGDAYGGSAGGTETIASLTPPFTQTPVSRGNVDGANLMGRWRHVASPDSETALQLIYDRTRRKDSVHREIRTTWDVDFQHRFALGARQEIVCGVGYRTTADEIKGSFAVRFSPDRRRDQLFSGFLQDDLILLPRRLRLTLGSKFEHNDYTGFEIQPNIRLLYTPAERHTLWASVSRAVRTPSRFEQDARINLAVIPSDQGLPVVSAGFGNDKFSSERLMAYEVGLRSQPLRHVSLDVAAFYNDYSRLRTFEPGEPALELDPLPPHILVPFRIDNLMEGETYGVEIAPKLTITSFWRLSASYTFLEAHLRLLPGSHDTFSASAEGDSPHNQFHLRSFLDLPYRLQLDTALYYVDSVSNQSIPSYVRVDARVGWNPVETVEVSVVAQNLFNGRHQEAGPAFLVSPTVIERRIYGKLTWRF